MVKRTPLHALYILTDALNFTTAVHATPTAISDEVLRMRREGRPLETPLRGVHWHLDNSKDGWKKCEEFVWP